MVNVDQVKTSVPLSDAKRRLLEAVLKGDKSRSLGNAQALVRRDPNASIPQSLAQQELWHRMSQVEGRPPFDNESITIHRHGSMDARVLERCFVEILRRHEAWRTTFDVVNGETVQVVRPAPESFPIARFDLTALSDSKEKEALRLATEMATEPFQLQTGPIVRVRLIDLDANYHRVHVTMHQGIVDGVSVFRVLPSELTALYDAFANGQPSPLPELPFQYGDFACWQKQFLEGNVLEQQLKYWDEQLAGDLPPLRWPANRPELTTQTFRGAIVPGAWPKNLLDELRSVCKQESVTLFMVLLAGFVALLHRYTGQEDILVGTLAPAGRERQEVQGLLGYFLNPVALRFRVTDAMTFRELLRQTFEVLSDAVANDDVPFHRVVRRLAAQKKQLPAPLFDAVISLAPGLPELPEGWGQTFMDVESGGAPWNLYVELNERENGLMIRAQYNPDRFENAAILKLVDDLSSILHAASETMNSSLGLLRL